MNKKLSFEEFGERSEPFVKLGNRESEKRLKCHANAGVFFFMDIKNVCDDYKGKSYNFLSRVERQKMSQKIYDITRTLCYRITYLSLRMAHAIIANQPALIHARTAPGHRTRRSG